mgnify:CR=1 FL=1
MFPVKRLDGSTSYHILDFKISATMVQDQAAIAEVADTGGGYITDATTTSLVDFVGSVAGASVRNPDGGGAGTLTYSTTQADTEGLVRVYINPDIIYKARMSGGATLSDLETLTNTTASAAGTTVSDATTPAADMDDGTAWGIVGANAGLSRKITTYTANTSFVVTVPFPRTLAVGDTFHVVPYSPCVSANLQLTTNLVEANATIAFGTGGTARVVELVLQGAGDSHVHFIGRDMAYNELS